MNLSYLIQTCELNLINSSLLNEVQLLPNIKKNTAYIVGVVLLNEKNQVCLIQEAKSSCYKKWYQLQSFEFFRGFEVLYQNSC